MNDTKVLIEKIKKEFKRKKGKKIVVADLTSIEDTICKYFVICQGNSPSQVSAIVDSIKGIYTQRCGQQALCNRRTPKCRMGSYGLCRCIGTRFLPETRAFYNLEHLWADAKLTQIPDLD